jgi:hypothetical protein
MKTNKVEVIILGRLYKDLDGSTFSTIDAEI